MTALEALSRHGLVPVVVVDGAEEAEFLGELLVEGGLPVAEVTFRTGGAEAALSALAARGDVLVGAGTILTAEQVDRAVDAGAAFIVSPGLDHDVVLRAQQRGVTVIPGVATPTELQAAMRLNLNVVKVFPARVLGGIPFLQALAAPFPGISFMPSGGIQASEVQDYLALPAVVAVGGSWMVERSLIRARDEMTLRTRIEDTVAGVREALRR